MEKSILFGFVLLLTSYAYPQGLHNDGVYNKDQIETTLKTDIAQVISRDDPLSFEIKELSFAADKNNKYMVDVVVNLFEESDLQNPAQVYSWACKDLQEVRKDKALTFKAAYNQIFVNINIENISYISLEISFTKLDDPQATIYREKLAGLMNFAFSKFTVGATIKNILGATEETGDEKISFATKYYVPLNFSEHYEKVKTKTPVLIQSKDMVLAMKGTNKLNDNSLLGKLKGFINAGSQIFCNSEIIQDNQVEQVVGYCTFAFSKTNNSSIPAALDSKLNQLMESSKDGDQDAVDKTAVAINEKAKSYKDEKIISKRTYDNVKMFTGLVSLYNLKEIKRGKEFDKFKDDIVSRFAGWLENAADYAITYNLTRIFIRDIYQNSMADNHPIFNDAKIYIPYSLENDLTLYVIRLQLKLHEYTAMYLKEKNNYQDLVGEFSIEHEV